MTAMRFLRAARGLVVLALLSSACHEPGKAPSDQHHEPRFSRTFSMGPFWRGNVHTHTIRSDGDSPPEAVASWYRNRGYQFLALTDHNIVADLRPLQPLEGEGFVLLSGEEVSMWHAGRQVHITALCTHETIGGGDFPSASEALRWGIRHVQMQDGVALINHPNFDHAISSADVPSFAGASLLEVFSGHPHVPSAGDESHPSHEALWDLALGSGMGVMGVAVDDMHHLQACAEPAAYPEKGWVYVSTMGSLARATICEALRAGLLVASNGPEPRSVIVSPHRYLVEPADTSNRVVFIGSGGRVLESGVGSYQPRGDEGYVRARIEAPDGTRAWTPAVNVERK